MSSQSQARAVSTFAMISLTLSAVALGQSDIADAEERLETIEVRSTYLANEKFSGIKTQTPVIDVPQSLSVVTADQIAEQGFADIGDILQFTPAASIGQGEGHRDQFTIRGQNTTADFFLDGLRDDVQYFRPLYNLQQVEILRGSNAMIFGRGGGGGIINRVTKRADHDRDIRALSASADTFGSLSGALDFNMSASDTLALRINAFAESQDNHREAYDGNRFAINPTLSARLSPDTDLTVFYEYVDDERVVDRGVPSENGKPVTGYDDYFFGSVDQNETTLEAHIAKARLNHKVSDTLSANITVQYADYDKAYSNLFPVGINTAGNEVTLDGYSDATARDNLIIQANVIALLQTGPLEHTLLFGAEFADQSTLSGRFNALFDATLDDQITLSISDPLQVPSFAFSTRVSDRRSDVEVHSIYVQDQIDVGRFWKVVGGLRLDQFKIDVDDRFARAEYARTDEEVSPRIGVIFKPAANISAYASYSKSFLPRSGDQFLTLSASTARLDPEEFENQEVGIKWDIRSDLSLTAALFQLDRDTSLLTPDGQDSFVTTSTTEGFELELNGRLTDRWSVNAGYSLLDSVLANGNDSPQVPETMFSLWNRFEATDKLGFGLGVIYQDAQFAGADNRVTLPEFVRVDAAAHYTLDNGTRLRVNIENLLDEAYFPAAHSNSNISTGASLNVRFGISSAF